MTETTPQFGRRPGRPRKAVKSSDYQMNREPEIPASEQPEAIEEFGPRPNQRFGALRIKLGVEPIPGYEQRWINDIPGRIDHAKNCGYSHVLDGQGSPIYRVVGTKKGGGEMRAYRMKIPTIWYDENKAEEQEELVDSVENQIRQGYSGRHVPGQDGAYVPTHGPNGPSRIKVTTSYGKAG